MAHDGGTYYINMCSSLVGAPAGCAADAPVCYVKDGEATSYGSVHNQVRLYPFDP